MFKLHDVPSTPAFVVDAGWITRTASLLQPLRRRGLRPLYSIKALPFVPVMKLLEPYVEGFSVSSLFEARLARSVSAGYCHLTTPGLRADEIDGIGQTCSHVSFNSLSQFKRLHGLLPETVNFGIRVNPGLSLVADARYDPCRPCSKLGVPIDDLARAWDREPDLRDRIGGLHVHNAYGRADFLAMERTIDAVSDGLAPLLERVHWINLGGGYVFDEETDWLPFERVLTRLQSIYGLQVFFEPGNGLVGPAGYLVASVIDVFESNGKTVAVLDTSINHHPEIFEYQTRPELAQGEPQTGSAAILAGCSCLAGDLFGEYRFERPPAVGDRIAFRNVGAYSLIKATRFNGHNLPSVVFWDGHSLHTVKSYTFADYQAQWTADDPAARHYASSEA